MTPLPLSGIKIIEFTHAVMGPSCGLILADLGADIIRIEPSTGDPTRNLKGFGKGYYPFYNRNKESIAINIKTSEGKSIVRKMVEKTDILIENFGPGTMDRLGYGYEDMTLINPALIYASLKGFLSGPYENRHAMDEVVQMMGGLAYMTGLPGQPLRAGASVIDISGGMFAAMGILTALFERKTTNSGKYIKSSLYETCAFIMGQHMAYSALSDEKVPPMTNRVSAWAIYKVFDTKDDEQIFVGVISEKHWEKFCHAFECNSLLNDSRLKTNNDRIRERKWFIPEIEKLLKSFTKDEIIYTCERGGIPFAPIACPEDLFDDIQLNYNDRLLNTEFPDGTQSKMPRLPIEYGDSDLGLRKDPPNKIGKDTEKVLTELGLSSNEIERLKQDEVIYYES